MATDEPSSSVRFDPDAWPPGFKVMVEDPDAEHSIQLGRHGHSQLVGCKCGWVTDLGTRAWSQAPAIYLEHLDKVPEQRTTS